MGREKAISLMLQGKFRFQQYDHRKPAGTIQQVYVYLLFSFLHSSDNRLFGISP